MTIVKKNPAYLNDLVNSRQPANTVEKTFLRRKAHLTSSKEVAISFSTKPKEATKLSIKKISSVSMDNESVEVPKSSTSSVFSVVT